MATPKSAAPRRPSALAKSRIRPRIKPTWERGYYSHGLWQGKKKVGTVKMGKRSEWDGIYRWQAGNHVGEASTLGAAKRSVEQAVFVGASQLSLFGDAAET